MPFDRGRRALFVKDGLPYPTQEEVQQKVGEYRALWQAENKDDQIIRLMVERTGCSFPRDIEVFVFGKGMTPMSHPFLMPAFARDGASYSREKVIETLVHETLHRFLSENIPGGEEYGALLNEFADEHVITKNHIFIYAFLEIILGELYGTERLKDFIAPHSLEYKRALDIVAAKGASALVSQFHAFIAGR